MGGLRDKMPITFWTFLIGTLAIAGVPGLAGFFSKDEILWHTLRRRGHTVLWLIGDAHRGAHRVLHVPAALPDLLRRAARRRTRSSTTSTSRRRR